MELNRPQATVPDAESLYRQVPWLRKSATNSVFVVLHLLTLGMVPFLLVTCIVLMTGDIYYNKLGPDGRLQRWSPANKVVAWILMIPPLLIVGAVVVGLVGGLVRAVVP